MTIRFNDKLLAFVQISRIPNDMFIGFAVLIGMILALNSMPPPELATLGFLSGFFISASVMVSNDIFDLEIDKINNPARPLPRGALSIRAAWILVFVYMVAGLFTALSLGFLNFVIAVLFWILGLSYNKYLKKTGLLGNMAVSSSVAIPFIYGSIGATGYTTSLSFIFALLAFLANTGREIIKGVIDLEGDRIYNVKTLAVRYGEYKASLVASLFIITSVILSPLPLMDYGVNSYIYIPLVLVTDIIFIYSIYSSLKLAKSRQINKLHKIKKLLFIGMGVGLLAFTLGALFV